MTSTLHRTGSGVPPVLTLTYGVAVYAVFLAAFAYSVAFVEDLATAPRTVDHGGPDATTGAALLVNVLLLSLFAVQHSVMARQGFKRWWARIVPVSLERSTYVLLATACLVLLMALWHPVTATVWDVSAPWLRTSLVVVSLAGWLLVLASTFLISHADLFGLRQVLAAARSRPLPAYRFVTPYWYRLVRHPIYLGFVIAFWVTPTMSIGHLLFAVATTGYILVGIQLEERDLVQAFGDEYRAYRRRVPMLLPRRLRGIRRTP